MIIMTDIDRLKKLLNLTTSTYNGEALNAIRKANTELQRKNLTWDELLDSKACSSKRDFADDIMSSSLRKTNDELRKDVDKYKDMYWSMKFKYDDLVEKTSSTSEKTKRQSSKTYSSSQDEYDKNGNYIPKSKRKR